MRQFRSCGLFGHAKLRKRVPEPCPGLAVSGGETLVEQARIEASAHRRLVHLLADEDELLRAIAEARMPVRLLVRSLTLGVPPVFARHGRPPHSDGVHVDDAAGLRPLVEDPMVSGDPEEAFRAEHAAPVLGVVQERPQLLGVEGLRRPIGEARNPVLFGLRRVLALKLSNPAGGVRRLLVVEQARVEHAFERDLSARRHEDLRAGVERFHDGLDLERLIVAHEIELVQHDDVGELDLVNEQVGHRPVIFFAQRLTAVLERLGGVVVPQEARSVHNCDHRVEARNLTQDSHRSRPQR